MEIHGSLQLQLGQDIENFSIPNGPVFPEAVRPGLWFWLETLDPATTGAYMSDNAGRWLYVQHLIQDGFIERIGDTMLGPLTLAADPVNDLDAVTKQYVDNLLTNSQEEYNAVFTYDANTQVITCARPFVARSPRVHVGGQRLDLNIDYTEISNTEIQLISAPTVLQTTEGGNNIVIDIQVLSSLREAYNINNLTFNAETQQLHVVSAFVFRSTRLYVGGQRQSLGSDYTEIDNHTLQLISAVTVAQIDAGNNIVLDFQPLA